MKKSAIFGLLVFLLVFSFIGCDNGDNDEVFTSSTNETISNDINSLGLVGTSVSSSNVNIANVVISSGKIKITSVGNGSAVITVSEGSKNATINVTVSKTGSITIGTINKYNENVKTIVGNWIKSIEQKSGKITVNSNGTWSMIINDEPYTNGTWNVNGFTFIYDYDPQNPVNITVQYQLSNDKNSLTFSGEDVQLLGGTDPWNRDE